jgi:hypothetical protein
MGRYNFIQDLEMLEREKMIVITRTDNVMTAFKMSDLAVEDVITLNYVTDILMRTPQGALLLLKTGSKKNGT